MRTLLATALLALGLASSPAMAGPSYRLTDLGVVDGYTQSFAYGLSDNGAFVAGWLQAGSVTRAFRWSAGAGMEILALDAGMTSSRAFGVNDSGVVAGESVLSPTKREATLWTSSGVRNGLGTLPNPGNPNSSSVAFGVNNSGVAAGWSDSAENTRAFRWTSVDGMASLGALPGGTQTRAYSIAANGQIVGWGTSPDGDRGFVASPSLSSVGALSAQPGSRTRAFGGSNNGWVTGDASDPAVGDVAFLWSSDTSLISLGKLAGAARSFGADVNSAAAVVGWNEGGANGEEGFLWTAQDGMLSFNTLLLGAPGWQVQRARSINDLGYVVANAVDSNGQVHAVLLVPVPEPSTWAVMLAGLLATFIVRRRQAGS